MLDKKQTNLGTTSLEHDKYIKASQHLSIQIYRFLSTNLLPSQPHFHQQSPWSKAISGGEFYYSCTKRNSPFLFVCCSRFVFLSSTSTRFKWQQCEVKYRKGYNRKHTTLVEKNFLFLLTPRQGGQGSEQFSQRCRNCYDCGVAQKSSRRVCLITFHLVTGWPIGWTPRAHLTELVLNLQGRTTV